MFFSARNFGKDLHLPQEQLEHIARVANGIIDKHGILCWGNASEDKKVAGFSSSKNPGDTHVGILIGVQEIRAFDELPPSKRDKPEEMEEISQEMLIKQQEKEIRELRKLVERTGASKGPI